MKITLFIILAIVIRCQLSLNLEAKRDRFVLREKTAFELDCNNKLEKVTRVVWEFISNSANEDLNETIYDSQQPNNTLKSGFEVSCQKHETLISKCSLKLVQARKEDSGKYICYVGQEVDAEFDSNALKPVIEIELVVRGPTSMVVVVNKGDPIILPCEHNIKNLTRARWSHVSTKDVLTYAIYHMPAKETSNKNYEVQCEPHELSCNLTILKANKKSAGKYVCKVGESQEFEKKYGLDSLTHFIEIELVVGELECNENMNRDQIFLGENDCYGIEADVLNLKCSFNYFGNINYNLLHLGWIEKYKFNSLEKKLNSSPINHEVKDETNKISIQTNLSVAYEMQNSIFQCVLDDTQVKPCQLHEFKIEYIKNMTERSPLIHSNKLHNMKCLASKSANVQCSYYWVHQIAGAMVENPYAILPVENMNSPGIYTCIAKCHLGSNKECIINAMEVEVVQEPQESSHSHEISNVENLNKGLIATLVVILLCVIIISIIIIRKRTKRAKKSSATNNAQEGESMPLMNLNRPTADNVQTETKEVQTCKSSTADKNVGTGDYRTYDILLFQWIGNASSPDVSQTTTVDLNYRYKMLQILIKSHPNPNKVLVIGIQNVNIVENLLKQTKVESITLCLAYKGARSGKYHNLIKRFLGRVKIMLKRPLELLENHRNCFDIIINNLSYSQTYKHDTLETSHQEPDQMLDEAQEKVKEMQKICEFSKQALKGNGMLAMNLEVFGENVPGHIIERGIVEACRSLFPVAIHIVSIAQPLSNVDLKCLFCSLSSETDFKSPISRMSEEQGHDKN